MKYIFIIYLLNYIENHLLNKLIKPNYYTLMVYLVFVFHRVLKSL